MDAQSSPPVLFPTLPAPSPTRPAQCSPTGPLTTLHHCPIAPRVNDPPTPYCDQEEGFHIKTRKKEKREFDVQQNFEFCQVGLFYKSVRGSTFDIFLARVRPADATHAQITFPPQKLCPVPEHEITFGGEKLCV